MMPLAKNRMARASSGKSRADTAPSAGPVLFSDQTQGELRATVASAAFRIERWLAVARIIFYAGLLAQAVLTKHRTWPALIANAPRVIGVLFSISVLWIVRRPPTGSWFFVLSAMLDTLTAHAALAENIFSPGPGYWGILRMPETSGILISTAGAGLRLSVAAACWGGIANAVGVTVLVWLDRTVRGAQLGNSDYNTTFYYIFIGTMTMLAVITAVTIRRLVLRAATVALRADRAERGLGTVLADCHDARSVLTAARLNAEMIQRNVGQRKSDSCGKLRIGAENLIENLAAVESLVLGVKDRALADLCTAEPPRTIAVRNVLDRAVGQVRLNFDGVHIECKKVDADLRALVSGGEMALHRILMNLLANACEGNGQEHATLVDVSVQYDTAHESVAIRVADNGPGIRGARERVSSKMTGSGVGLHVVRGIAEASGGRFFVTDRLEGGTVAHVILPAAHDNGVEATADRKDSAHVEALPT